MGGTKKKPISKMDKLLKELEEKQKIERKTEGQRTPPSALVDEKLYEQIRKEVVKQAYVTPYLIASRYNLRYSAAKEVLRSLVSEGVLKLHAYSQRLAIYVPAAS
ncbi:MAG: 30S ribosomal protein S25e [Candidatus Methanomethylicota archaeon]|uniref:30S ribosomal protein S25e n=1 Tax=Thermoproteota archaeon TaxID=2056631 RepID=A0A497F041_9CREN|nr:MAG: 30S ribosomal protein S25e [Candidatus Verstraetearchaeota archaeon]RLE52817.1 MAG: 30S ribosomal protein S25e [Candidatus Verstraetearchaeota archaeon]